MCSEFLSFRDDSEGKRVKLVCAFSDDRTGKNRSITDVDWSPKVLHCFLLRLDAVLIDAIIVSRAQCGFL